jgi:hypothetical protein
MTTTQMVNEVMYRRGPVHPYTPLQMIGALREMFAFRFSALHELDELLEGPSKAELLARSLDLNEAWFRFDEQGNYVFDRERMLTVLVRELDAA